MNRAALQSVEIQRSPNTAQFGSDGLGGNVQLISRQPQYGLDTPKWNGEFNTNYGSADTSFGGNALLSYGAKRFGVLGNIVGRRVNTLRTGGGVESHSAITRFLGLPSDIIGSQRLPDTAFTQFGGTFHLNFAPSDDQNFSFRYQRNQQDGGKRYDQLIGGDGNLIADLRNLMLDFGYIRYFKQKVGFFDHFSASLSYNSQREERVNQGGQGNPLAAITNDKERTSTYGFSFYLDKQFSGNNFLFGGDIYQDKVTAPSFSTEPSTRAVTLVRPRIPNGAKYNLAGVYVQNVIEAIPDRLRFSGSLRYNVAGYKSQASNSPLVGWQSPVSGRFGKIRRFFRPHRGDGDHSRGVKFCGQLFTRISCPEYYQSRRIGTRRRRVSGFDSPMLRASARHIGTTADATAVSIGCCGAGPAIRDQR